jgi:hypothetical protein
MFDIVNVGRHFSRGLGQGHPLEGHFAFALTHSIGSREHKSVDKKPDFVRLFVF